MSLFSFLSKKKKQSSRPAAPVPARTDNSGGIKYVIRIRNLQNTHQVWNFSLAQQVIIGRDPSCQVCVDDKSVSRKQCVIYIKTAAYIENLSTSNITLLNDQPVTAPARLNTGDKIKCGQSTLVIESLNTPGTQGGVDINMNTVFINV